MTLPSSRDLSELVDKGRDRYHDMDDFVLNRNLIISL